MGPGAQNRPLAVRRRTSHVSGVQGVQVDANGRSGGRKLQNIVARVTQARVCSYRLCEDIRVIGVVSVARVSFAFGGVRWGVL